MTSPLRTGMFIGLSCSLLAGPVPAQVTEIVSVNGAGEEGDAASSEPGISSNGRYVAFESDASDLVAGDGNGSQDIFVHDRVTGITERVSVDSSGAEADGSSFRPAISADGRFVTFSSFASNLVAQDHNGRLDVFVHDRSLGETKRASVDFQGNEGDGDSDSPSISANGRWVGFTSFSALVPADTDSAPDVYLFDGETGAIEIVSVDSAGVPGNDWSLDSSISADGRWVAFDSIATNLVPGDTNNMRDVFLRDRELGTTIRVSLRSNGDEGNGGSSCPSLSSDGSAVAFQSAADNLVSKDRNQIQDIFVHTVASGKTRRVSVDSVGIEADGRCSDSSISADGSFVAFASDATNLVGGDGNDETDTFLHSTAAKTTVRVSVDSSGQEGDRESIQPAISADGRHVAFSTASADFAPGDRNDRSDAFVHGPWLLLDAEPSEVYAGDLLTLSTRTGKASGLALLAAVEIDGVQVFLRLALGRFNNDGVWIVEGSVPSGLAGIEAVFLAIGQVPDGALELSNPESLRFQ